ncbi:MAG TPA: helix-turn-helix domain-containing protein [Candidatus Limnocylindrales bacterium]|nr:helix-turn-helix domain-containing protein [Candidatus Limnocylindrales bacterium]
MANTIQSHISYLRTLLGDRKVIVSRAGGYLLDVAPQEVDAIYAQKLIGEAAQCGDPAASAGATLGQVCYGVEIVSTGGVDQTFYFTDFSLSS